MGLTAIYIIENGLGKLYYTASDHLGSICQIIETNGTVAEETNYDPWGRTRNADNWTYTDVLTLQARSLQNNITNRGYTGHQMLDEFGIIDMNGRIYDPVLARFFSPDPFVQAPNNTQSFNRYSYCVNNPLRYTDPTGEFYNRGCRLRFNSFV